MIQKIKTVQIRIVDFAEIDIGIENYTNMDPKERRQRLKASSVITDKATGNYYCKFCNQASNSISNVITHIENAHVQVEAYECEYCGMRFKSNNNRTTHIYRKHSEERQKKALFANFQ